jgi:hypothetical protein
MPSYLTFAEYKLGTTIKGGLVDLCTQSKVEEWLDRHSSKIRNRLTKRYAVDFKDPGPVPGQIKEWLTILVDINVLKFTGGTPEGREDDWAKSDADKVEAELKEAVEAQDGLFELPLRNTDALGASAVSRGGPLMYTETNPYRWTDIQYDAASQEVSS